MSQPVLLTLDAGTSGGRAALFGLDGQRHALRSIAWSYEVPAEVAPWGRSFDPHAFWGLLASLARQTVVQAGVDPDQVAAVSVAGQRQGLVLLDEAGTVLYAGPNHDLRALYQAGSLDSQWGQELYAITGHQPALLFAPARLRWLQERHPSRYARVASLLMISDWLVYALSGALCTEPSAAAESQLFDIRARRWSQELAARLDLPAGIYPPVGQAGTVAGALTPQAAYDAGLRAGTPVVIGGADTQCGLLGMAVTEPGSVGIMAGWSMPVQQVLATPVDGGGRLWTSCHVLPGRWVLESNGGPAGRAYAWLRETLFPGRSFQDLEAMAEAAPAGAAGSLAFLGADAMDAGRLGLVWGGLLFPLGADFLEVDSTHLVRAALEHVAFAAKANLQQLTALGGHVFKEVALGGGMGQSRLFPQLLADVLGMPVHVPAYPEASSLGAAMAAAAGAGFYPNLWAAAKAMTRWSRQVEPQRVAHAEYLDIYEEWQVARRHLRLLSEQMG